MDKGYLKELLYDGLVGGGKILSFIGVCILMVGVTFITILSILTILSTVVGLPMKGFCVLWLLLMVFVVGLISERSK